MIINTVTYVKDTSDTSQPQLLAGKSFRSSFLLISGMPLDALSQKRCSRMKGRSRWETRTERCFAKEFSWH